MSDFINTSICLSDIPKDKITVGKNGKKYLSVVVDRKREVDQWGNSHTLYVGQGKEEREAKENKCYIGSGKEFVFNNNPNLNAEHPHSTPAQSDDAEIDDLPF